MCSGLVCLESSVYRDEDMNSWIRATSELHVVARGIVQSRTSQANSLSRCIFRFIFCCSCSIQTDLLPEHFKTPDLLPENFRIAWVVSLAFQIARHASLAFHTTLKLIILYFVLCTAILHD
jgi:hypothetical protein